MLGREALCKRKVLLIKIFEVFVGPSGNMYCTVNDYATIYKAPILLSLFTYFIRV